jgi:dihydroorotase-like cyclic amidohydrolase
VRLFKWVSLNPANIIGVDHQIGSIEKLKFADLVIWEPFEVAKTSHSHPSNPETCVYKDMHLTGRVHQDYIRGNLGYERDTFFSGQKICTAQLSKLVSLIIKIDPVESLLY